MSQETNIESIAPRSEPMERATPGASVRLDQFGRSQRKQRSLWGNAWRQFRRHKLAMAGLVVFGLFLLITLFGPLLWNEKVNAPFAYDSGLTPSTDHPMGTDSLGQDMLARILWGGRISLSVGLVAALISVVVGTLIGAIAGFFGGAADSILMRVTDMFISLPQLPLLLLITFLFSQSL